MKTLFVCYNDYHINLRLTSACFLHGECLLGFRSCVYLNVKMQVTIQ